jgi:hypothetical protein
VLVVLRLERQATQVALVVVDTLMELHLAQVHLVRPIKVEQADQVQQLDLTAVLVAVVVLTQLALLVLTLLQAPAELV